MADDKIVINEKAPHRTLTLWVGDGRRIEAHLAPVGSESVRLERIADVGPKGGDFTSIFDNQYTFTRRNDLKKFKDGLLRRPSDDRTAQNQLAVLKLLMGDNNDADPSAKALIYNSLRRDLAGLKGTKLDIYEHKDQPVAAPPVAAPAARTGTSPPASRKQLFKRPFH